jgi:hypothetical protein
LFGSTAKDRNSTANMESLAKNGAGDELSGIQINDPKKHLKHRASSRKKEHIETVSDLNKNSFNRLV